MTQTIISLLPHDTVVRINGRDVVIPPSGQVARVAIWILGDRFAPGTVDACRVTACG